MKTAYISSISDLHTWIHNTNPGNVMNEDESGLPVQLAEAIRDLDGRPAWGEDWAAWLDENAEIILCAIEDTDEVA